jgi:hypothetical protein
MSVLFQYLNVTMPYDMPASARMYYELWHKNANKQLQHPNDWDRFYLFVSILLKFSKKKSRL